MVGKHGGAAGLLGGIAQQRVQVVAVVNVIAQYQRRRRIADEFLADDERLRQSVRRRLHRVLQVDAPLAAVAQQILEARRVLRRGDDQDVAHAGQHQRGQRMIDHRLVVDRQQLLGHAHRHRIQPGAGAAGQDDAFTAMHGMVH